MSQSVISKTTAAEARTEETRLLATSTNGTVWGPRNEGCIEEYRVSYCPSSSVELAASRSPDAVPRLSLPVPAGDRRGQYQVVVLAFTPCPVAIVGG